jgi:hypothetical protein
MRIDALIHELSTDARWQLGTAPATAMLNNEWSDRLPVLLSWGQGTLPWRPGTSRVTASVAVRDGRALSEDWYGDIDIWPDAEDRIIVRRVPVIGENVFAVTLAAARTPAAIERFVAAASALWRRWRRECEPALGRFGRVLDVRPVLWDDLCLPPAFLDDVRTTVESFARAGDRYRAWRMPYRRGLLFHGAPGNGKTMLCRAIVTALGWPVIYLQGEDAHGVAHAFEAAHELAPCVLCFEDVDTLFGEGGLSSFLNRLDGIDCAEGLLVLATTNHPEKLDPALTARPSRFDRVYAVEDPDREQRARYLGRLFAPAGFEADAIHWLAAETEGMSMAFLKEVFLGAALRATARGLDQPTLEDARRSLPQVSTHRRAAKQAFSSARSAGFTRSGG